MILNLQAKRALLLGTILLALAVLIGAFGAHGLKNLVAPEKLVTFEVGVRYHFYHGFGLVLLGLFQQLFPETNIKVPLWSFVVGILLFSFNCYFYALSGIKIFGIIVPVGGVLFTVGWTTFALSVLKLKK